MPVVLSTDALIFLLLALALAPKIMWMINPANNTHSMGRIRGYVAMNVEYDSKVAPLSVAKRNRLMVRWTTRKLNRNKPLSPMISFRPTEDMRNAVSAFMTHPKRVKEIAGEKKTCVYVQRGRAWNRAKISTKPGSACERR